MKKVVFCCLLSLAGGVFAADRAFADSQIGAWIVHVEKDPFTPKKKTIALSSASGSALVIRCFPDDGLSVLIMPHNGGARHYEPGAEVSFKYRADEGEVVEDKAEAFGEHAVAMPNARQILGDSEHASTIYVRVGTPDETMMDLQFKTKGAGKALAGIKADCPIVEPPKSDDKSAAKKAEK